MHKVRFLAYSALVAAAVGCAGDGGDDLAIATASQAVSGSAPGGKYRCAVEDPGVVEADAMDAAADAAARSWSSVLRGVADEKVTVRVHFHVITTSDGGGDVSALVPAQIAVLNQAYAASNFKFKLASVETVANDDWFFSEAGSPEEVAMKAALRRGGAAALNVYSTLGDVYLGWATFPKYYRQDPLYDGIVVYYATLPGTGFEPEDVTGEEPDGIFQYDEGDTLTHEAGHWLGLFHTFQGGCSAKNDRIKDTPAEAEPQFFCVARDSCTGRKFPGFDPITNYMDYVDDACMFEFTTDQTTRMHKQWNAFRRPL